MTEIYQCRLGSVAVRHGNDGLLDISVIDTSSGSRYTIDDGTQKTLEVVKKKMRCAGTARTLNVAVSRGIQASAGADSRHRGGGSTRDILSEMMDQRDKLVQMIARRGDKKRP